MTPETLYSEATKRGLFLSPRGDKLAVRPKSKLDPDFAEQLRRHKAELIDYLEARALPLDCRPWVHIARQVVDGEFAGVGSSTREALQIGLRGIDHPLCRQAIVSLNRTPVI